MQTTTIDILRHGKTLGGDIFRGHTDVELSDLGRAQMLGATEQFCHPQQGFPWQQIISSPLVRCAHFAQQLADKSGAEFSLDSGIREISFGDWDGQLMSKVKQDNPDMWRQYIQDPTSTTPPNGEPMRDLHQRVEQSLARVQSDYRGQHVLLVCHGGVFRVLLGLLLKMPLEAIVRFDVPYACISRFNIYHHQELPPWPQLVFHSQGASDSEVQQWLQSSSEP